MDLRYNEAVGGRWEFVFMSAANRPVSQFWGWYKNPFTGQPIEPDPESGLVPYRGLEPDAQTEIIANLTASFIGNRHDGDGTWKKQFDARREHNRQVMRDSAIRRGDAFAHLIKEVDLRRPWVKHHSVTPRGRRGSEIVQ